MSTDSVNTTQKTAALKSRVALALQSLGKSGTKLKAQEALNAGLQKLAFQNEAIIAGLACAQKPSSPAVSVLVPVFNTASYLHKCLDSLTGQSMKDIEIICVDDGSKDNSWAILEHYAQKDARVRIFKQDYLGVSAARNTALAAASAAHIMFCDSDDSFAPNMCERMYATITTQNVDVAICAWNIIFEVESALRQDVDEYLRLKYDGHVFINWQQIVNTDVSLCNKIYKRSIIDAQNIRFPNGLLFEDAYFNDAYMSAARTAYYLNEPLYNYLRHEKSIMSDSYQRIGTAADYLEIAFKTYDYLKSFGLFEHFRDFFWNRFMQYYSFAQDHLDAAEKTAVQTRALAFIATHQAELEGARKDIVMRVNSYAKKHGRMRHFIVRLRALAYRSFFGLKLAQGLTGELLYLLGKQQGIIDTGLLAHSPGV